MTTRVKRIDVDQALVFVLLAVTVAQMGWYLASYAPPYLRWLGYLQAIAVDCAIWRSAYWYRKYTAKAQRRWALIGVISFSIMSAAYNFGYYTLRAPGLSIVQRILMAIILPGGVALLSYLYGQKDVAEEEYRKRTEQRAEREAVKEAERARLATLKAQGICRICEATVGIEALNIDGLCDLCQRRKEGKTHSINPYLANQVLERDNYTCYYCGADMREAGYQQRHIDHFFPRIAGGQDILENLVTSCQYCNTSKKDRLPSEDEHKRFALYLKARAAGSSNQEQILALATPDNGDKPPTQLEIAQILHLSQGYVSTVIRKARQ